MAGKKDDVWKQTG